MNIDICALRDLPHRQVRMSCLDFCTQPSTPAFMGIWRGLLGSLRGEAHAQLHEHICRQCMSMFMCTQPGFVGMLMMSLCFSYPKYILKLWVFALARNKLSAQFANQVSGSSSLALGHFLDNNPAMKTASICIISQTYDHTNVTLGASVFLGLREERGSLHKGHFTGRISKSSNISSISGR